jgi:hypothetical protein
VSRTSKTVGELICLLRNKFLIITQVMASADGDPEKISQDPLVTNDQTLVCNPNWKQLVF